MTPLLTKWRELKAEFKLKFPTLITLLRSDDKALPIASKFLEDFHRQSLIAIIEGEILRLEGEKMVNTKEEENSDWFYGYGFNAAIDQQISYYQSTLEGLKKL